MSWSADVLLSLNEPAAAVLQASVDLLADDGPSPELVEVLSHYALGLMIQDGDPRAVLAACDRALEMSRRLALPEPVVALSCRGGARLALGERAGLDDIERAVAASREQGLGVERATLEMNSTSLVFAVRGVAAERAALDEVTELVRRTGIQAHVSSCRVALVDCLAKAGKWDEALKRAAPLAHEFEATDDRWDLLYVRALQALVHARRGTPEAAPILDWIERESRRSEIGWTRDTALFAAAAVQRGAGRGDAALGLLEACFSSPRAYISILEMVPEAVRTAVACGAPDLAARVARQVEAALPASPLPLEHHVVASVYAGVAETRGEYEAAAAGFAIAAEGWHEFGMPYEEGQALLGRCRCLVALGRWLEAAPVLVQARGIFARLGAAPALLETAELQAATDAGGPTPCG